MALVSDAKGAYGAAFDGVTDDAARIQAAIDACSLAGGGIVGLASGVAIVGTTLSLPSDVILQGCGRRSTVLRLKPGTALNALIESKDFATNTLSANIATSVPHNFAINDLTLDGNDANNAGTPSVNALRLYAYDYDVRNLDVELFNCSKDVVYTEYSLNGGIVPGALETRFDNLRIQYCTIPTPGPGPTGYANWRMRGPHDSLVTGCIIGNPKQLGGTGFWMEGTGYFLATVASGSNGVNVNTFAGAGTINVNTTLGKPVAGSLSVATGSGNQTVTYTGKTATSFTGCSSAGAGVMSTGGILQSNNQYLGGPVQMINSHVWGNFNCCVVADDQLLSVNNQFESANQGTNPVILWLRAASFISGGTIFTGAGGVHAVGIQLGDTTYGFFNGSVDTAILGCTGGASNQASLNVLGFTGGSTYKLLIQPGTPSNQQIYGTLRRDERRQITFNFLDPTVAVGVGLGTSPPAAVLQGDYTDHRGQVSMGSGTTPAAGAAVALTFSQRRPATAPVVIVQGANAATVALGPYVSASSGTGFTISFANAPAASQSIGTYLVNYSIEDL